MISSRSFRWMVVGVFALVLCIVAVRQGLATDKEALKYVGCATDVLHGNTEDLFGNYAKYAAYVLFLLPFMAIGVPALAVVVQFVLAVLAALALARIAERITGSTRTGDIAFAFALLCYPLQVWVLALYTESFFASVAVLFIERVTREGRPDVRTILLGAVVLFARPVGMLVIGPALVRKWSASMDRPVATWLRRSAHALVLVVAMCIPGIARDQLAPIVEGHVICGFPERPEAMADFHGSSIIAAQVHLFAYNGTAYAAGLFFRRIISLFTLARSYYSSGHKAVALFHYALFPLAVFGWWRFRTHAIVRLCGTVLLLNVLLVGLTHDEWSGRFLVPIWPVLIMFAALGAGLLASSLRAAR